MSGFIYIRPQSSTTTRTRGRFVMRGAAITPFIIAAAIMAIIIAVNAEQANAVSFNFYFAISSNPNNKFQFQFRVNPENRLQQDRGLSGGYDDDWRVKRSQPIKKEVRYAIRMKKSPQRQNAADDVNSILSNICADFNYFNDLTM